LNPIKQNQIHVNAIKSNIEAIKNLPLLNIVVFMNRGNLDHVEMKDNAAFVMKRKDLGRFVKIRERALPSLNIDLIFVDKEVTAKNTFSKENLRKHINKIKSKYKRSN
jgi:hypothetical protein